MNFEKIGDPIVVISHPRSGTHLTIDLLRKQFLSCVSYKFPFEPQDYLYLSIEGFLDNREDGRHLSESEAFKIIKRPVRPIIKFHTYSYAILKERFPQWMEWIEEKGKFIFVMRDVREVLCSYYVFAQSFELNANVPIGEFIKQKYCGRENRVEYWREVIDYWSIKSNVLLIDYDNIIKDTKNVLTDIGSFLGEKPLYKDPLLPRKIKDIWEFRWNRVFAIRPENTAILGSKDGKKLNWRKVLSQDDLNYINEIAGSLMKKYNYNI